MKNFWRIIKYTKKYWIYIVLNFFSNLLFSIFSLFSLVMVMPFLDILFEKVAKITSKPILSMDFDAIKNYIYYKLGIFIDDFGKFNALILVSVLVVVFSLLSNFFRYMGMYFMSPLRNGVVRDLKDEVYNKLLILPLSFYSKMKTGDVMSRISSDVSEVEWSVMSTIQLLLREPLMIIIYFITLISMSVKLTMFSLVLLPISGLLISFIGKKIKKKSEGGQVALGGITSVFEETISGLRIIKGFNAIGLASEKFHNQNKNYNSIMNKLFRYSELGSPMSELLGVGTLMILVFFGGLMVLDSSNNITADILIAFVLLFARIISPAQSFISATYSIQKGMAAGNRIFEILDANETIFEKENPIEISKLKDNIVFENVCFSYENEPILKNINLNIKKGCTVAIVGHSGAGKSTLVDLLPRFYDTSSGKVLIDGVDLKDIKISDVRSLMGIVNQDVILFNDSIFNNIAFGIKSVNEQEVIEAAKNANAHEFIAEFPESYKTMVGDRGARLSGGQRQRLSIARALLKKPDILIFDEATSALDTESERIVQEAIDNMMKNRTTFIIAHRLSTIRKADVILVMKKGEIVESGNHESLIQANGVYKKMVEMQNFKQDEPVKE